MKSKAIIPLALGLVVGLVALKLGVSAIRNAQGEQTVAPEIDVVVSTVDVPPTVEIKPDMVVVKKTVPTPLLPADAFGKIEDVVGRVTSKTFPAGTPVSPALLAPEGTLPGLQVKIQEGYRAVSVKIDEVTGVAYQLMVGSYVDVLVVMDVKRGRTTETMSKVILQNIQVAAVGQVLDASNDDSSRNRAKSVTLLVRVEEVPTLHLAQTKGRITLAMRGGEDELVNSGAGALASDVLGMKPKEEPGTGSAASSPSPLADLVAMSTMVSPAHGQSHTTVVINGPLGADTAGQVLRVTYKDAKSMEVLEVNKGRTSGDSNSMKFGTGEAQRDPRSRKLFGDRDQTLRRRGARGGATGPDDEDSYKETGE